MRLTKLSLIAALALGTLLAGANLASAQDAKGTNAPANGKKRGGTPAERVDRMATELNLTADQKTKVTAQFEEDGKKMRELRADTSVPREQQREKMRAIRDASDKKLKTILTPDQWDKLQKQREAMGGRGGGKKAEKKTE
jgi:protein CpxP